MDNFRDSYFQVDWDLTTKRIKGTYWGKQYDTGRGFAVTVINGGQVVAPTTEVLRLKWEKPDNTTGYVNATIVNGKFIVENIDQMFTVHGLVRADFELSVGGEFVASITFYVNVEKAVAVDAIESSSDFTALQDAVGSVDSLQQQLNNVVANVTVDSEVIAARGTEATLGARLGSTDAQLADIENNIAFYENLISNGDFSESIPLWTNSAATSEIAIVNGTLEYTTVSALGKIVTPFLIPHNKNDVFYYAVKIKAQSAVPYFEVYLDGAVTNREIKSFGTDYSIVSGVFKTDISEGSSKLALRRGTEGNKITVDYVILINLTETFGVGSEPSSQELDTLFGGQYFIKRGIRTTEIYDKLYPTLKRVDEDVEDINSLIVYSTNMFNSNLVQERRNILDTGVFIDSETYAISDFIKVKPNQIYSIRGFIYVSEFTENNTFIKRSSAFSYDLGQLTTTDSTAYVVLHYQLSSSTIDRRLNEGSTLLPYEDFYTKFSENKKLSELNNLLEKAKDKIMLDMPWKPYSTDKTFPDYTGFNAVQSDAVYDMFDALLASYPDYITKEVLTPDSLGNAIAAYKFTPIYPQSDQPIKRPQIFINCGSHGYEHMSTLATYLTLKAMCEDWETDETLEFLRHNIDFVVIPVANPSGWNLYERYTSNGVDINRNFPYGWVNTATNGTAPMSEIETQNIVYIIDKYSFDVVIDFHNFHEGSNGDYFIWITGGASAYLQHIASNTINYLSRRWNQTFDFIPSGYIAGYTSAGATMTLGNYARNIGIKRAYTLEICNTWMIDVDRVVNDQNVCRAGVETLVNFLGMNILDLTQ